MHFSLFFSPSLPISKHTRHIRFLLFSFSFPFYYSFLFSSLPSFVTKQSLKYKTMQRLTFNNTYTQKFKTKQNQIVVRNNIKQIFNTNTLV